uniref:Delta-buthitoxin-Hj1a n=2 Tax=Hottentotta TaxID=6862 RepID=DEL1A_HOTJU|nr:RecName: Full=Delta-buthitoxin-Hj1a; Short=Delta-BUTX-Hj1a [Hottentotta judaicus]
EEVRDAYIAQPHNCVYHCFRDSYCNDLCIKHGAESGECKWFTSSGNACWCVKLPKSEPIKVPGKCH